MAIFGLYAHDLRVKVTREPATVGSWLKVGGQIGYKQKDGSYINRWVEVWFPAATAPTISKGDVLKVSGRYTETEREYQGKKFENRHIWAENTTAQQSQSESEQPKRADMADQGSKAMDDVPFALLLIPLAGLFYFLIQGGLI